MRWGWGDGGRVCYAVLNPPGTERGIRREGGGGNRGCLGFMFEMV